MFRTSSEGPTLSTSPGKGTIRGLSGRAYAWLAIVAAVVTAVFLIALATNVAPWLRGPKAWRWPYAIPGTFRRLWLPAVLLLAYIALAQWLQRRPTTAHTERGASTVALAIVASALMTPAIQLALLYMDHPDVRSQLFYRTVAEGANGFFNVGAVVIDRYDFLRYFADRMLSWYPTHPERHPPGLPVLFSLARQFFDAHPVLAARLNDVYRPYQCHNVPLMNLPDGAIASATLQMALPLALSLVVPPLYLLGREIYDRATGLRAILLWPLVPGVALWAAFWTPLYALFTVLALLLFHYGLSRQNLACFYLSGLVISVSLFLSFGNVAIVGYLGIYALIWLVSARSRVPGLTSASGRSTRPGPSTSSGGTSSQAVPASVASAALVEPSAAGVNPRRGTRPTRDWLAWGALLFVLGAGTLWAWLWFRYRLSFTAVWRKAMGKHLEMDRSGWFWILYHLYDFFVAAAGIPILFTWAARTWDAFRGLWSRRKAVDVLALTLFAGLVLMDLSGVGRGEVARVWAFVLPLPLLVAVHRLPRRGVVYLSLIALLSLQLFVSNVYVRYIGTDLLDPPAPPPPAAVSPEATPWWATWEGGIALRAVQVPETVAADQPIAIRTVWTTSQQIHRPYTAFVHMLDPQGELVAQRDAMPIDGGWPTTCWRPGESFEDSYTLVVLKPLAPGTHRLEVGFYWLPSGERLPVSGQGAQPDHSVDIGTIEVKSP